MLKRIMLGVLLSAAASLALAQVPFRKVGPTVTLAVTSVSSNVAVGTAPQMATLWVCNTGANVAYVQMGDSTVVADTTGIVIPASPFCGNISPDGKLFIAAVTQSSTTTLTITPGAGLLFSRRGGTAGAIGNFILLVDGISPIFLVDGSSNLCLASGC